MEKTAVTSYTRTTKDGKQIQVSQYSRNQESVPKQLSHPKGVNPTKKDVANGVRRKTKKEENKLKSGRNFNIEKFKAAFPESVKRIEEMRSKIRQELEAMIKDIQ